MFSDPLNRIGLAKLSEFSTRRKNKQKQKERHRAEFDIQHDNQSAFACAVVAASVGFVSVSELRQLIQNSDKAHVDVIKSTLFETLCSITIHPGSVQLTPEVLGISPAKPDCILQNLVILELSTYLMGKSSREQVLDRYRTSISKDVEPYLIIINEILHQYDSSHETVYAISSAGLIPWLVGKVMPTKDTQPKQKQTFSQLDQAIDFPNIDGGLEKVGVINLLRMLADQNPYLHYKTVEGYIEYICTACVKDPEGDFSIARNEVINLVRSASHLIRKDMLEVITSSAKSEFDQVGCEIGMVLLELGFALGSAVDITIEEQLLGMYRTALPQERTGLAQAAISFSHLHPDIARSISRFFCDSLQSDHASPAAIVSVIPHVFFSITDSDPVPITCRYTEKIMERLDKTPKSDEVTRAELIHGVSKILSGLAQTPGRNEILKVILENVSCFGFQEISILQNAFRKFVQVSPEELIPIFAEQIALNADDHNKRAGVCEILTRSQLLNLDLGIQRDSNLMMMEFMLNTVCTHRFPPHLIKAELLDRLGLLSAPDHHVYQAYKAVHRKNAALPCPTPIPEN